MSDDTQHQTDELDVASLATEEDDSRTESASITPEGDEESSDLDLEPAVAEADRQTQAWLKKIREGKATLEELKEKQAWLAARVEPLLTAEDKEKAKATEDEILRKAEKKAEELTAQMLANSKREEQFEAFRSELKDIGLTKDQAKSLAEEYEDMKKHPHDVKALKRAAKLVGIEPEKIDRSRRAMQVPETPGRSKQNDPDEAVIMDQVHKSDKELMEFVQKRRGI